MIQMVCLPQMSFLSWNNGKKKKMEEKMEKRREYITIESDGTGMTTRVFCGDKKLPFVTKIEIDPLKPDGIVTAKITFMAVKLRFKNIQSELEEIHEPQIFHTVKE